MYIQTINTNWNSLTDITQFLDDIKNKIKEIKDFSNFFRSEDFVDLFSNNSDNTLSTGTSNSLSYPYKQGLFMKVPTGAVISQVNYVKDLADNETKIIDDLIQCQGTPIDIGGYYKPDPVKTEKAMRPSETFNNILGN